MGKARRTCANAAWLFLSTTVLLVSCTARSVPKVHYQGENAMAMELSSPAHGITALAVSRDGAFVLTADNGGASLFNAFGKSTVRLWDIRSGRLVRVVRVDDLVASVELSPDGRYAVLAGRGGMSTHPLKLLDLSTGRMVWERFRGAQIGGNFIEAASFSPDGRYLLVSGKPVSLLEVSSGNVVRTFGDGYASRAIFSPDGRLILTGNKAFTELTLLDAGTGQALRSFKGHDPSMSFVPSFLQPRSLSFSPDGRYVMSSTATDDAVIIREVGTGREIRRFAGFQEINAGFRAISAAYSPDGRSAVIEGFPFKIWDIASGAGRMIAARYDLQITANPPNGIAFSPDGRSVIYTFGDGALRITDAATAAEKAMLVGFEDGEWIVITSEGYYNASEKGAHHLVVRAGEQRFDTDLFYDVFYRPDIVLAKLRGEAIDDLVTITMEHAIKSPPPVVEFTAGVSDTGAADARVCYRARSTGGGIGEVRVFQNGKLVRSDGYYRDTARPQVPKDRLLAMNSRAIHEDMRGVAVRERTGLTQIVSADKGDLFEECASIDAVPGENEVSITAFNRSNTVQSSLKTVRFFSRRAPEEPHLYLLSIGIDRYRESSVNLKYAAKDAKDIAAKLVAQASTLYRPGNVHHEVILDREAAKENILARVGELAGKIRPADSFILFAAGHGVLLQNQYFMLTHGYAGELDASVLISTNEIVEISKKVRSLSQLFVFDTCHAGGVDAIVSGLYDARMSVLAKKMGLHIYASASSLQAALDGYQGNGLFTHALLDGLNGRNEADADADGKISIVELGDHAKAATGELSRTLGRSQTPLIINFGRDSALYRLR